ncbi:MAG: O-acetylhomoserine aminocarboxypropyltransferase/cysteine synthase family protein [Kineosporiaceae bacterium]
MPARGFATDQIHAGDRPDPGHGARIPPVHLTAGFRFTSLEDARARFAAADPAAGPEADLAHPDADPGPWTYTRIGNPTIAALERRLAHLEGGDHAIAVASGQAAVTTALLGLLQAGDRVLAAPQLYEGTRNLLLENFARFGIETDVVRDPADPDAWRGALRPTTRVLFGESVANPTNEVLDIAAVAGVAHAHEVPLVVDNTLATPYLLRPIEHGADVVVHSASKFLSGHGAALAGAVVTATTVDRYARIPGDRPFHEFARHVVASRLGPVLSPLNAFLVQQGIETLSLRMRQHSANALVVAQWLERQPEVTAVDYAGIPWRESYPLARRYLPRGAGAVLAFTLAGGEPAAAAFLDSVEVFSHMTHLGDVRSLVMHPASTTHAGRTAAERAAAGIHPGTLRLSVGIEDVDDLVADLARGLAAARVETSLPALAPVA